MRRGFLALLALVGVAAAGWAEELPEYPDEQQALLRQTEDELLGLQRRLFAARQRGDQTAVTELTTQYKAVQDKRWKLIKATEQWLPSDD